MLDDKIVQKLKERYSFLHPLILHRSFERAKSNSELFDILDTVPKQYPVVWCEKENRWLTVENLYLNQEFLDELK
jgi:hypothetical protein